MSISIKSILKQSSKFNAISVIALLLQIPNQLIIGRFLEPEEFGVVSFVALWSLYAGFVNPGMVSAAQREIPHLIGKDKEEESVRVQNIAISSDLLYSIFPFLIILYASLFYSDKVIKTGLILTAFNFILGRLSNNWTSINFVKQRFTIVAFGRFLTTIFSPIIVIGTIYWFGVYAVLMTPLICTVILSVYYLRNGSIGFRFQFEWEEIVKLVKIGFILNLSSLLFYIYRMTDRTIISSFLSMHELGIFSFAMVIVMFGVNFIADFGRVLQPILWEHSGKSANPKESFRETNRMAIYMAIITSMLIPLIQLGYGVVVQLVIPKYLESIQIFIVLTSMLYLSSIVVFPNLILCSTVVNKQSLLSVIYAIGVGVNVALDLLVIYLGYGIEAIAIVTIVSEGILAFLGFYLVREYLTLKRKDFPLFLWKVAVPFIACAALSVLNYYLYSINLNILTFSLISVICQIIIWFFVLMAFYRDFISRGHFI